MLTPKNLILFLSISFLSLASCCKDNVEPAPTDCICYEIYAPVCGSDGMVYPNDCYAECAGVDYTPGFCEETHNATIYDTGPIAADGCGWQIALDVMDDDIRYNPSNLSNDFKEDKLKVRVTFKKQLSSIQCGLAGTSFQEVEIIDIKRR
ncbi:MAG: Kazal-type serine protease inhibitor [Saprospiraceae bacterium]